MIQLGFLAFPSGAFAGPVAAAGAVKAVVGLRVVGLLEFGVGEFAEMLMYVVTFDSLFLLLAVEIQTENKNYF